MTGNSPRIMLLAGEISGDTLGASLIDAIQTRWPNAQLSGMGGDAMLTKGMNTLVHANTMAVMGVWEVITHAPTIIRSWLLLKKELKQHRPLVILIDYPGFNLRFAKLAHRLGCRVIYLVSPQIWAWKAGRIHTIKKTVDHMAVLFPFEQAIYDIHQVPNSLIRHPLVDNTKRSETNTDSYKALGLQSDAPLIALCPGSRHREINLLLPPMADACKRILKEKPDAQFILCLASHLKNTDLSCLPKQVRIIEGADHHVLSHANAAIVASGTMTLELALLHIPMVITYRMHPISFWLAKRFVSTRWVGLCNIIAEKSVAPEFLQEQASGENLASACLHCLNHPEEQTKYWQSLRDSLSGDSMESLVDVVENNLTSLYSQR